MTKFHKYQYDYVDGNEGAVFNAENDADAKERVKHFKNIILKRKSSNVILRDDSMAKPPTWNPYTKY